ncbi:esterase/lipase family protein [Nocardia abscessus]|uniref:esterase/lipase family protein n=1 Tax=Nocardia abscessus TaxID=120957 RepID=UPI0002EAF93A|nr:triacylglycerol lipase [Nocardia abscessus]MCC3327694.1 triacylglycerol lipase [Nocardia abscessus]
MHVTSITRRLGMAAITLVATATAALGIATPQAAAAPARDPILFVHGWRGSAADWNYMWGRFLDAGYSADEMARFSYNSTQSNKDIALEVKAQVDALRAKTGAAEVDIITHSMGGLNSRWYLKNLGGLDFVDDWVSIGGPNHGTDTANGCLDASCVEMRPGSAFLAELNGTDETPGRVNYGTWWSPCDEIINPDASTILSGAGNTQTACIGHVALLSSPTVFEGVRDFVK